ncbi:hypothetical protein [Mesorhizobium sp. A556]
MASELGSTYARLMIETLLHVHALTNMHRSSGVEDHRKAAANWLPTLESQMNALRRELSEPAGRSILDGGREP